MAKRIISLLSEDFEDLELWYPVHRLREEGCIVDLVAEEKGKVYHGKYGVPCQSDYTFDEVEAKIRENFRAGNIEAPLETPVASAEEEDDGDDEEFELDE